MSLRLRLTLLSGLVLMLVVTAFAGVAYAIQSRALQANLDGSLQQEAEWLSRNAPQWFDPRARQPRGVRLPDPRQFPAPGVFVQVVGLNGDVQSRSTTLGAAQLPVDPGLNQRARQGESTFTEVDLAGAPAREYVAPLRVGPSGSIVGVIQVARPIAPLRETLRSLQMSFLGVGAAGILVSVIAGWLLARASLRPIDRLAATAQSIGARRDFARRVPAPAGRARDEVGRLTAEFNNMLSQLEVAYSQLEQSLAGQRRFVADASHELRTPLAVVRGNLDLLLRSLRFDQADQAQALADAVAETERMGRLVADLLLLAQADAGQHLSLRSTSLEPVLATAFRAARLIRPGIELHLEPLDRPVVIDGDADRLQQVLLILLDNAIKYTPAGGRVTLEASADVARGGVPGVEVRVTDTGPGIAAVDQERIFERFSRLAASRGTGGAGLGLAIARWIVQEHAGTLQVSEAATGPGSVFRLWLPARVAVPSEPRDVPTAAVRAAAQLAVS